ncbi:hypothetical protein [Mycolicibacterium mengxianglii]|uniref:hypothetical protein n=1 Tax=Mycolicibacterium mengxianglii TaxID=2736649 RepID=UPI0018EF352C|nr:hypothetical protein [Mycolicibacterium mengxianglii]
MTTGLEQALLQLPATPAITYRGLAGEPSPNAITLSSVLPSSLSPRVATENFTAQRLVAIVTITGRYIAPLSQHPDEHEIALLPGTVLLPVGSVNVEGLSNPVVLLAEPGDAPQLPPGPAELRAAVIEQVSAALAAPAVPIHSPGRFTPASRPA